MRRSPAGLGLLTRRGDDDIVSAVANLFDVGIVLALGFMVALISALNLLDVFAPDQKVTITKERADGLEITIREGRKTTIRRLSKTVGSGDGARVGVAYRLEDGSIVYVPEGNDEPSGQEAQ
ncbi:DUF2149 domain-containing protein [Hyphomicrobium sp. CS1GBMeth3]|uniref:DUF2149 domain-containing protein n=1 Tax=Hyphomicrobium sp. CS1GBMeth3 TaxID=1892845 RepID=UPI00093168B5|nr:DUF2149 domain-containing protein [Hyphomicrobium sp. CS1GBMeth3]